MNNDNIFYDSDGKPLIWETSSIDEEENKHSEESFLLEAKLCGMFMGENGHYQNIDLYSYKRNNLITEIIIRTIDDWSNVELFTIKFVKTNWNVVNGNISHDTLWLVCDAIRDLWRDLKIEV